MTRIVIINAGMSEDSATARLGHAVDDGLRAEARTRLATTDADDLTIDWVDLRPLARDIIDNITTGFPSPTLGRALSAVHTADALVALTPVYQASYSGLFKSFIDIMEEGSLAGTPVLLGATGGSPRHSLVTEVALRPLFIYLRTDPVPTAIYAATEDWGAAANDSDGTAGSRLERRIRRAARELLGRLSPSGSRPQENRPGNGGTASEWDPSLVAGPSSAADAYPGFTDFETLMARGGLQ